MDAGLAHHTDVCDVTPVDAQVGAADGDGDSSQQGAKARDDLGEREEEEVVSRKKGFGMD